MKQLSASCASILLLLSTVCFSQKKTALIVAIGDYPSELGWMKISSANDVPMVKNALLAQGFQESDIQVLSDADATKEGIIKAIRSDLINKVERGGVAYFHYSGHGQQIMDDNKDELDGYDEALVPYDSPLDYVEGVYEGENLLRDEELGGLFDEVRERLGPSGNLLVVLDACHSGTGTRGMSPARGTTVKMAPKDYTGTATRGTSTEQNGMESNRSANLAPMAAFFGAAPNQLNFETKDENGNGVGSLSYAFCKKFAEATPSTTYRGLFDKIKMEMSSIAPRQQPQVEGELDQQILGGTLVEKANYFPVKWSDSETVTIQGGWLQQVEKGALVGLYPSDTRDFKAAKPIMKGQVVQSDALSSVVFLEGEIEEAMANDAWAFVLEKGFGDMGINVVLDIQNPALENALKEQLAKYPSIHLGEPADVYVLETDRSVQMVSKDEMMLEEVESGLRPPIAASRLVSSLRSFGQAKFLRKMEVESYDFPLEFEFIPVQYDRRLKKVLGEIPLEKKIDADGTVRFKDGDAFQLKVHNRGYKSAYFTLLDIQPDNHINILVPDTMDEPADFRVGPGESVTVPKTFEIGPPAGTEVFKLVGTSEPIDLRSIVQTRGQTRNVPNNPFERLFSESFFKDETSGTRGGRSLSLGGSEVHVFSKVFIIE